jgi:Ca2+-dependent lipid-binding protein
VKEVSRDRILVRIVQATGLRAADTIFQGGKSDPYVVCHIRDRQQGAFSTSVVKKCLDPVWHEEHIFRATEPHDIIDFEVYDHDVGKADDFLGRASLQPSDYRQSGGDPFKGVLQLEDAGKGINAELSVEVTVLPQNGDTQGERAFVRIERAHGLRAVHSTFDGGKSNPYVVCQIPGKPYSKWQTAVRKKTLEPEWHEEVEVTDYLAGDNLEFTVLDHDLFRKQGEFLGTCMVGAAQIQHCCFSGELQLTGNKAQGFLTVTIEIV